MASIKPQALLQRSKKKKAPTSFSLPTIALYAVLTVLMVFFLFATYRHWSQRSIIHTEEGTSNFQVEDDVLDSKKSDVPRYTISLYVFYLPFHLKQYIDIHLAFFLLDCCGFDTLLPCCLSVCFGIYLCIQIFNTSKGLITMELFKEGSPEIVDEFIDACQKGRFRGMLFQHVVKHFVIQGGDSENHAVIEDWISREKHYNQLEKRLKHEAFMLGTSNTKLDKEGFDIFVTTTPTPDLNAKLNVFGRVIKGEDIVQEIEEVDTDEHYRPKSQIGIIDVTLKQKI